MDGSGERLALIEILERDGRVRRCIEVLNWPVTLGRALDCDVVVDDPHVAAHHLRLEPSEDDGALLMHVGATRNGVQVGPRTIAQGESAPVPPGHVTWQLGATRLRVRRRDEALEPEKPLGLAVSGARPWVTVICALAVWAPALAENAVMLDPGSSFNDWLSPLIVFPGAVLLWCLPWAIGSKLFQHRFEYWPHFAVVVKGLLAAGLLELVLPMLAFSFSWEGLSRITPLASSAVGMAVIYGQARLVATIDRRLIAGALAACYLIGTAVWMTLNHQRTDRYFSELYLATLPPPGLRLAPAVSTKTAVDETTALRARLDARVAEDARRPGESDSD